MDVTEYFLKQPRYHILALFVLMVTLIALLSHVLAETAVLTPLYVIPVAFSAVALGFQGGLAASLASVLALFVLDLIVSPTGKIQIASYINGMICFGTFIFITLLLSNMRLAFTKEWSNARTDPTTGIANKEFFLEKASRCLGSARRDNQCLTMIALTLNRLKEFNDQEGATSGDALLGIVAKVVTRVLRSEDIAGRYSGTQILMVLPNSGPDIAKLTLERLNKHLVAAVHRRSWSMTFTIAAVTFEKLPKDVEEMRDTLLQVAAEESTSPGNTLVQEVIA